MFGKFQLAINKMSVSVKLVGYCMGTHLYPYLYLYTVLYQEVTYIFDKVVFCKLIYKNKINFKGKHFLILNFKHYYLINRFYIN